MLNLRVNIKTISFKELKWSRATLFHVFRINRKQSQFKLSHVIRVLFHFTNTNINILNMITTYKQRVVFCSTKLLPANIAFYPWYLNEISIKHFWNHTTRIEDEIHTHVSLDAFAKLRKATVSFFVSVRLFRRLGRNNRYVILSLPLCDQKKKSKNTDTVTS